MTTIVNQALTQLGASFAFFGASLFAFAKFCLGC